MRDLVTRELIKRLSDENEEAVVKLDCCEHLLIMYKRVEELMQLKDARKKHPGREHDFDARRDVGWNWVRQLTEGGQH